MWPFDWLFRGGVGDAAMKGAAIGGAIGYMADIKSELELNNRLIQLQIAQANYLQAMHEDEEFRKSLPVHDNGPWPWEWERPMASLDFYKRWFDRYFSDEEFRRTSLSLGSRWLDLSRRALKCGILPTLEYGLLRTVSGDIVGTPAGIEAALNKLQADIEIAEVQQDERLNPPPNRG